jgi:hypothetical protein
MGAFVAILVQLHLVDVRFSCSTNWLWMHVYRKSIPRSTCREVYESPLDKRRCPVYARLGNPPKLHACIAQRKATFCKAGVSKYAVALAGQARCMMLRLVPHQQARPPLNTRRTKGHTWQTDPYMPPSPPTRLATRCPNQDLKPHPLGGPLAVQI